MCLAFLFTLEQDVSKIGILINKKFIMYYFNFFISLKISSCLMMYFCCRQRKLKCRDLKRENSCTCWNKVQKQKTPHGTYSLFVWDKKCSKETYRFVETERECNGSPCAQFECHDFYSF